MCIKMLLCLHKKDAIFGQLKQKKYGYNYLANMYSWKYKSMPMPVMYVATNPAPRMERSVVNVTNIVLHLHCIVPGASFPQYFAFPIKRESIGTKPLNIYKEYDKTTD